jgi:hypothetical protein
VKSVWSTSFPIVDADGEYTPEFEAYFAQELARLEADVDDPMRGEDARDMLEMDREELRALSAVTLDLMNAGPPPMTLLITAVLVSLQLAAIAAFVVWFLL